MRYFDKLTVRCNHPLVAIVVVAAAVDHLRIAVAGHMPAVRMPVAPPAESIHRS